MMSSDRPSAQRFLSADLPSRFEGDTFALVFGNTGKEAALQMGKALHLGIRVLSIREAGDARLSARAPPSMAWDAPP